ncbi:unnamed protein product, partial [Mesorhabditis belari]|uniref:HORMA domain-containing protein n=1 Tax=Mesorhabditis belari TaxID=2138241 RepID=A0AAF3EJW4_9BILA
MALKTTGITYPQMFKAFSPQTDGIRYLQRVAYYAMVQIACARKAIHPGAYMKRAVDGQPFRLYVLKKENDFVGKRVHAKLMGALDAVALGYLKELIMVISNNEKDSDDALEVFTMRFVYGDEPHLEFVDSNGLRLASSIRFRGAKYAEADFFKFLDDITILCHVMDKLPKDAYCSLRSTYYNELVPENYVPNGWYDTKTLYDFDHPDALDSFAVGQMHASDAALFLSVKSFAIHDEVEIGEAMKRARNGLTNNDSLNKTVTSDESSFFQENFQHHASPIISGSINGAALNRKEDKTLESQIDKMIIDEQVEKAANRRSERTKQKNLEALASHSEEDGGNVGPIKKGRNTKLRAKAEPILARHRNAKTYRLDKSTPGVATPTSPTHSYTRS